MTNTDTQLKQALAKMLPEKLRYYASILTWRCKDLTNNTEHYLPVNDTELLHLCWLVEETLTRRMAVNIQSERSDYAVLLQDACGTHGCVHATWQQKVIYLAKVKGIII